MKFIPHKYQEFAIEQIVDKPACGLFLDLGMGKTVITLTAINQLPTKKTLVIAPLRVAQDTWSKESEKWDHLKRLKISKVLGPEKKRRAALKAKADLYVINRENVAWLVKLYGTRWPFDTVIIDELSSFKSAKSQRFKALRKVRPLIKRIVGLTGTPSPNGLLDLWPQIYLLDRGERLGKTLGGYRERYFVPDQRSQMIIYSWKPKVGAEAAIYEKISDICVSMKAQDYLGIPERINNYIRVEMSAKEKAFYRNLEQNMLLPFKDGDIDATNAATLSNKLLQMAGGAVYDENGAVRLFHKRKLEALEDLHEAANGNPILVFYAYRHEKERIQNLFKSAKELKASQDITDWNDGKIEIAIAHPASAGHGLNLQNGGHIVIWYTIPWSLELYQQANGRLHRQGQKETVSINHIITDGTIDEDVIAALERKDTGQEALLRAVRARIGE